MKKRRLWIIWGGSLRQGSRPNHPLMLVSWEEYVKFKVRPILLVYACLWIMWVVYDLAFKDLMSMMVVV